MRLLASLVLLSLLAPRPVRAGPAEDAALRATEIRDQHCADTAQDRASGVTGALAAVVPVLDEVSRVYDETAAAFLLYWRGVLFECMGREDRAIDDLQRFADGDENQAQLPQLVQDAERRLRRLGVGRSVGGDAPSFAAPRVTIAAGGNYELLADASPYHYGGGGLQGSVGLVGPLRLLAFVRLSVGPPHGGVDAPERSGLVPWGVGLAARIGDDAALRVGGVATFALDGDEVGGYGLLAGASALFGGAFQLGPIPLELQPEVRAGFLGARFHLTGGVSVAVRIGSTAR